MNVEALVVDLVRRLTSQEAHDRALAAEEAIDIIHSLGELGPVLAGVLALVRLREADPEAQEAELHALAELYEWGLVPTTILEILARLDRSYLNPSQVEYLDYLLPT
jgi:DNA-binding transcriptional ArsR family regulator